MRLAAGTRVRTKQGHGVVEYNCDRHFIHYAIRLDSGELRAMVRSSLTVVSAVDLLAELLDRRRRT